MASCAFCVLPDDSALNRSWMAEPRSSMVMGMAVSSGRGRDERDRGPWREPLRRRPHPRHGRTVRVVRPDWRIAVLRWRHAAGVADVGAVVLAGHLLWRRDLPGGDRCRLLH